LAVSARTAPRFTRDADLAVAVANDAEAEALIRRLRTRNYGIEAIVEQDAVGRLATPCPEFRSGWLHLGRLAASMLDLPSGASPRDRR
jgi:hypothetical protein